MGPPSSPQAPLVGTLASLSPLAKTLLPTPFCLVATRPQWIRIPGRAPQSEGWRLQSMALQHA